MNGQRILVTGGAGFIGSNLANHLAADNDVVALDDQYLGTPENLDDAVEFVDASVTDDDLPTDVDVVFHLAALSSYAMHEENPTKGARQRRGIRQHRPPGPTGTAVTPSFTPRPPPSTAVERNPLPSRWM